MRIASINRKSFVPFAVVVALALGVRVVHAQFAAPTCTPPNCSPAVIQNIPIASAAQNASINVTGDAKVGATFQVGANAPTLNLATDNLIYGNINGASASGSLLLLQAGAADRIRLTTAGQMQLPLGSSAAPSYSFLGDTNSGVWSSAADRLDFVTGGNTRFFITNTGVTVNNGVLTIPVGAVAAPTLTFNGDTNTGIYHNAADTMNFATNGINTMTISATNSVVIPGMLHVQGGIDGVTIGNINANSITSGTLNDARLSSNVALLNNAQTFTGAKTFNATVTLASQAAGTEISGTGENAFNINTDGSVFYRVDTNNNSASTFNWMNGLNQTLATLDESANLDVEGMVMFGSADVRLTNPAENLIYGNVDQYAAGKILLLQAESVDRFSVDADGDVVTAGTITSNGQLVCLANGTNCPPSVAGVGELNRVVKFTSNGNTVGNSNIWDDGSTVGIGGAPVSGYQMLVYGTAYANSFDGLHVNASIVGAGSTAMTAQVVGAGGTGITAYGEGYGVYGTSPAGAGVYGVSTDAASSGRGVYGSTYGTGAGVYGYSAAGWGGQFSSLNVTGSTLFSAGVTIGPNARLGLGSAAADAGNVNGSMYYNSATNKFRCYENSAWKDCIGGLGGSGTVNAIPKFTAATALGNSTLTDDGTNVTAAQNLLVNGNTTIGNAAADTLTVNALAVSAPNNLNIDANTLYVDTTNNRVGIGTAAPQTNLQVTGRAYVNKYANAYPAWVDGDLILGDNVTTRNGYGAAGGSHIFLLSNDKSTISALDEGNNVGQISYQNLRWNIGENVGWGVQTVAMPGHVGIDSGAPTWQYSLNSTTYTADAAGFFGHYGAAGWTGESIGVLAQSSNSNIGGGAQIAVRADAYSHASAYGVYASAGCINLGCTAYGVFVASGGAAKPGGGSWASTSDRRVKKDITPFADGLEIVRKVKPVRYTYNGLGEMPEGVTAVGVIAQDLQKIAPYMVNVDYRKLHKEDAEKTAIYMVDPSDFTYISLNAIKQLDLRIDEQGAKLEEKDNEHDLRIEKLELDVAALKAELEALKR